MKCSSRVLAAWVFQAGVLRCLALALAGVAGFPLTGWAAPGVSVSTSYSAPGYVIPGDETMGVISATANFTVNSAEAGDRTLRVDFQLVDAEGTAVDIETPTQPQKNATTVSVELTDNFPKGNQSVSVPVEVVPDERLDPSKTYQVRLQRVVELETGDLVPPDLGVPQTDGAANSFVHFFGGNGVVARMASVSFSQAFRIRTGSGNASAFRVTPGLDFYRYDPGAGSVAPEVELTCVMRDGAGSVVPLQESVFTVNKTTAMGGGVLGSPVAAVNTGIAGTALNLRPVAGLDSVAGNYTVTVTARFIPRDGASAVSVQNGVATASTGVLDFNGTIRFNTVNTTFTAINNIPVRGGVAAGRIGTSLGVAFQNGRIDGLGDSHKFGTGFSNLAVMLDAAGVAHYTSVFPSVSVAGPGTDNGTLDGVAFRRQSITLNGFGAMAGILRVFLPGGLGYLPDLTTRRATGDFEVAGVPLDESLNPVVDIPLAGAGWLHEESKPFAYDIQSLTWVAGAGRMVAEAGMVRSLRNDAVTQLAAVKGDLVDPAAAVKASNDHVFNGVDSVTTPLVVTVDGDGNARVDVSIALGVNSFFPHMPYADPGDLAQDIASTEGILHLEQDRPANESKLTGAGGFAMKYDRACVERAGEESGCAAASDLEVVPFVPTGSELFFTPDGGLQGSGSVVSHKLRWGKDPAAAAYTHVVETNFTTAGYLMAGSSLPGGVEGTASKAVNRGAWMGVGAILGSGVDAGLAAVVRPGTQEFSELDDVFADYPGLTFRVGAHGSPMQAKSRVAGVETPVYPLEERSHYYVRRSGISGIHQAAAFDEGLPLYGYDVALTQFQFSYLSNLNEDARSAGSVTIPEPSEFLLPFSKLLLSCPGGVKEVVLDGAEAVELKYWDYAPLQVLGARFETADGCDPAADGCLVLGVTARAQLFDEPLAGELGFRSTGQIATRSNGNPAVDSRLRMPAVRMPGPGRKTYAFTPVQDAYFNDEASAGGATPGFLNVFGTVSAPFFQDMKWHVQTKARPPVAGVAPQAYHVTGGWADGAATAFNTQMFDAGQRGFPPAIGLDAYRASSREGGTYAVLAKQSWLGIENAFHYNLRWNPAGRAFSSESVEKDFFVLGLTHRAKYLSPDTAEITFGVEYDGLPKINLAGFAASALDTGVGYTGTLVNAFGDQVAETLLGGVESGRQLVAARLDALVDPLIEGALADTVDLMLDEIYSAANGSGIRVLMEDEEVQAAEDEIMSEEYETVRTTLTEWIVDQGGPIQAVNKMFWENTYRPAVIAPQGVRHKVSNFSEPDLSPINFSEVVDSKLAEVEDALSVLTLDGDGVFQTSGVKKLIRSIVADQAPEFVGIVAAEIGGNALQEPLTELLNSPGLVEIRGSLESAQRQIGEARLKLRDEANGLTAQLAEPVLLGVPEISAAMYEALIAEVERYSVGDIVPLHEIPREQLKEIALRAARDATLGGRIVQAAQVQLREYVQDSLSSVTNGIDNGLQEVNTAMRDIIATQLASVDDSINQQVLGPMSDLIGAGRLTGYAHINGDSLTELRVDGKFRWKVPEPMEFSGFLLIKQLNSDNRGGCYGPGETANEITIGANKVPLKWISPDLKADVAVKFTVSEGVPEGMGGAFEMVGSLTYEAFKIQEMAAAVSFGARENYLAAGVGMEFGDYAMAGGVFFGRTCTLDPIILIDPEVAAVLGTPPFTGAYVYGEARIPVNELIGIPSSCMLRVKIGAGAGVFYFLEGPTYGGKLTGEVSGEALCLISIKGRMSLVGVRQGSGSSAPMRFNGNGRLSGKVGICRFCKRFKKSVGVSFNVTDGRINSPSIRY